MADGVRIDTDVDCYCDTLTRWNASVSARWTDYPNWLPHLMNGAALPDLDSLIISNNQGQGVQDGLNDDERQSMMTFWAMANAPLWLGGDLTKMDPVALKIVTNGEVISLNQVYVSLPELVVSGKLPVYKKTLPYGVVVAVYNLGNTTDSTNIHFKDLKIGDNQVAHDMIAQSDLGGFTYWWGAIDIPPHGSRLIRFTPI